MNVGLIDVDSHNFPSLPIMKLSAYHKSRGDSVGWWNGFEWFDVVYMSRVFDSQYTPDPLEPTNCGKLIKGGTGFGLNDKLPHEVEHIYPDYSLYPELTENTAYGFLSRGCPRDCHFCIVSKKEGRKAVKVADLSEFWHGQKNIKLLDPNLLACRDRFDLLNQLAESKAWVDFTQGLDARILTEDIVQSLNRIKVKMLHFAWDDMKQSESVLRGLSLYAEHGKVKKDTNRRVYVLTNYDTTHEEDLFRVEKLQQLGFQPYVMVYNKKTAPKITKQLARYCNNVFVYKKCKSFSDYKVVS